MVDGATTLVSVAPGGPVVLDDAPTRPPARDERILDAAVTLVARWGVTKTSLADIAKEAGCSRASLYRSFPGGKQQLFAAVGLRELAGYVDAIVEVVHESDDLADALTRGLVVAARLLRDHDAAQFVLAHEPELLLPFLGFKQVDRLYAHVSAVIGPHLERFLPAEQAVERAGWLAEWAARLFISYLFNPDPEVDLVVIDDARRLVTAFVLPAFSA
jgi:AcrR family transcriptional regulator